MYPKNFLHPKKSFVCTSVHLDDHWFRLYWLETASDDEFEKMKNILLLKNQVKLLNMKVDVLLKKKRKLDKSEYKIPLQVLPKTKTYRSASMYSTQKTRKTTKHEINVQLKKELNVIKILPSIV